MSLRCGYGIKKGVRGIYIAYPTSLYDDYEEAMKEVDKLNSGYNEVRR